MRILRTAAAQLGPIQKAESRAEVVSRMIALMDEAKRQGAQFIVYPELTLTTFFPRWHHEDRAEADRWFERSMPSPETQPLFDRAKEHGMGMSFGFAELTPEGRHFNTSILVDPEGRIVGTYRKVHLPGHSEFDAERTHQHLEKRYFEPGDLGFPVWRTMGGIFGMAMSFGYAELTPEGRRFNTQILVDRAGAIVGKYRKVHLPGHAEYDPDRAFQHLEKRYFEPGDLGFPVWRFMGGIFGMLVCNDRRWPEAYRVMGLQGVEMVVLGYNTPSVNSQRSAEGPERRLFHNRLSVQAGAYQNSTWVVAVAKAGDEDGHPMIGGSVIVNPDGEIVAEARTEGDELLVHPCDLDDATFGKKTIFDFARHRRPEHYGRITNQTGVVLPPEA